MLSSDSELRDRSLPPLSPSFLRFLRLRRSLALLELSLETLEDDPDRWSFISTLSLIILVITC